MYRGYGPGWFYRLSRLGRRGENYTTFTGETIGDFVENNAEYSDFAEALRVAGAFSLLESYGAYTCFVPDNEAMEAYASEQGYGTFDNFLDSVEAVQRDGVLPFDRR